MKVFQRVLVAVGLIVVVVFAYLAQYIFVHSDLRAFFPEWFLTDFPFLLRFTRWRAVDLLQTALWLAIFSGLAFGLLSPLWRGESGQDDSHGVAFSNSVGLAKAQARRLRVWGSLCLGCGVVAAVALFWVQASGQMGEAVSLGVWLLSLVFFLTGMVLIARLFLPRQRGLFSTSGSSSMTLPRPEQGIGYFLVLLLIAGFSFGFQLAELPVGIDTDSAEVGLHALGLLSGRYEQWFHGDTTNLPLLAYVPTAAAMFLAGDVLYGIRLSGMVAGLTTVTTTWLLGCEIFRRTPVLGEYGEVIEDGGRWMALIAAAVVAFNISIIHFSRLPIFMEAVAWGSLGVFLLVRGLRRGKPVMVGISGLVVGLGALFGPTGFVFIGIALCWWVGVAILQRSWLTIYYANCHTSGYGREFARDDSSQRTIRDAEGPEDNLAEAASSNGGVLVGVATGWLSFFYWAAALFVMLSPWLGAWVRNPRLIANYFFSAFVLGGESGLIPEIFLGGNGDGAAAISWVTTRMIENFPVTLAAVNRFPDMSVQFGYTAPLLNSLLAPILVLAVGTLLFHLDCLMGWLLLSWVGVVGVFAALFAPVAPYAPYLLAMIPALGLAIAFGFDRLRVVILGSFGTWTMQASVQLAVGLLVATSILNWIGYYQYATVESSVESYVGRGIHALPEDAGAILVVGMPAGEAGDERRGADAGHGEYQDWLQHPVIRLLSYQASPSRSIKQLRPEELPSSLAANTEIILPPGQGKMQDTIAQKYPGGMWAEWRNLRAELVLLIYSLPQEEG